MARNAPFYIVELFDANNYTVSAHEIQGLAPAKLELLSMMRDVDFNDAVRATIENDKGEIVVDVRKPVVQS